MGRVIMNTSVKAVIFDWAGTTVDYGSRAPMGAFVKLFESEGIEMTIAQARIPMGISKWEHINFLLNLPEVQSQWLKIHKISHTDADVDACIIKPAYRQSLFTLSCTFCIVIARCFLQLAAAWWFFSRRSWPDPETDFAADCVLLFAESGATGGLGPECFGAGVCGHVLGQPRLSSVRHGGAAD